MNVNVISKTDNAVLERKEIEAEISFEGATPSRTDIRKAICSKVGINPDLMVLREITSSFGKQSVKVIAHAYSKKEQMVKTEPEHMIKRYAAPAEEAKAEEPKAEAKPKEEKPKAEKKE